MIDSISGRSSFSNMFLFHNSIMYNKSIFQFSKMLVSSELNYYRWYIFFLLTNRPFLFQTKTIK